MYKGLHCFFNVVFKNSDIESDFFGLRNENVIMVNELLILFAFEDFWDVIVNAN